MKKRKKKKKEQRVKLSRAQRRKLRKQQQEVKDRPEKEFKQIETPAGSTTDFHQDARGTVVLVGKKIFNLVPTNMEVADYRRLPFNQVPHVRYLNPVPERTPEQQQLKNQDAVEIHDLAAQVNGAVGQHVTSMAKAVKLGVDPGKEVKRLLEEKVKAKEKGDETEVKRIRRTLRKLGYKRYKRKEVSDNPES